MGRLTERTAHTAKSRTEGQYLIRDAGLRGFALRVTPNGAKAWVWDGRINGRMRRITIGRYPDLSLEEARTTALAIRHRIALGLDPADEKAEKRQELTVRELARLYVERHAKAHKKSWREDERKVRLYFGTFASFKMSAVTSESVARWHQRIGDKSGRYMANRCLTLMATMFNLAERWGIFHGHNPAVGVKHFREEKRDRFLNAEELKRLNVSLVAEPSEYWRAYFQLAVLLGTRKNELLHARWEEMDLQAKTWRIPATKAGKPHLLPIPTPAMQVLESLPSRSSSEWVFPSAKRPADHLSRADDAWQRIQQRAGLSGIRIHDLRRTLASWLAAQGYSLPLIGRALNHTQPSTTAIYARLQLEPLRDALEKNAALMLAAGGHKPE